MAKKRKRYKQQKFTILDFQASFPDDDTCLARIFEIRFGDIPACPHCAMLGAKFYRVKKRKCYECGQCGHQVYPLAGTPMEGTNTKLVLWFFAIYLFATSKNGVSAMELQRQLGVTYKCAWRMGHKIRSLMCKEEPDQLRGTVEVDEAMIGGKVKGGKRGWGAECKTTLLGIMERGGRVRTIPLYNREGAIVIPLVEEHVEKGSIINTDQWKAYKVLPDKGYKHRTVNHSNYEWARGKAYTNSIEGYWSNLKKSILSTHTSVSTKHLPKYLGEFDFRHGMRDGKAMFEEILEKVK